MITQKLTIIDEWLDPIERLALAYAAAPSRDLWLGLLALDRRLARAAQPGSEPVLAQIKLAWWRDRFAAPAAQWPAGEPLLELLAGWDGERAVLGELVDGWEAREIGEDGGVRLRSARTEAMLALARLAGCGERAGAVRRAALEWQDGERQEGETGGSAARLPRAMRPLAILRGLALRGDDASPIGSFFTALRIGALGR